MSVVRAKAGRSCSGKRCVAGSWCQALVPDFDEMTFLLRGAGVVEAAQVLRLAEPGISDHAPGHEVPLALPGSGEADIESMHAVHKVRGLIADIVDANDVGFVAL